MKFQVVLELDRSTKNTHVYAQCSGSAELSVPTIYIYRGAMPETPPPMINVTIDDEVTS